MTLSTPVALSVFDRPETTRRVFQAIRRARPRRLFVFADGSPSGDRAERCERARAVAEQVDWPCEASYDYADSNLGARDRYTTGVDWVFSQVDDAIVLDDDCLPDPTFFPFCQAVLARYRDDPRVMMVCGTNYLQRWKSERQSFHFSLFGGVWGWASWKRAWELNDPAMEAWDVEGTKERVRALIADDQIYEFQARRFDRVRQDPDERHSWDLPWSLSRLAHAGLTVVPSANLVRNLGNRRGRGLPRGHPLADLRAHRMKEPISFPPDVRADRAYDDLHVARVMDWYGYEDRHERLRLHPAVRKWGGRTLRAARHLRVGGAPG